MLGDPRGQIYSDFLQGLAFSLLHGEHNSANQIAAMDVIKLICKDVWIESSKQVVNDRYVFLFASR